MNVISFQNSTECYCGPRGLNFIFVNDAECSIACAGAALEKCGSELRLSMYILTGMLYINCEKTRHFG